MSETNLISLEGVKELLELMDKYQLVRLKYGDFEVERAGTPVRGIIDTIPDIEQDEYETEAAREKAVKEKLQSREEFLKAEANRDLYGA